MTRPGLVGTTRDLITALDRPTKSTIAFLFNPANMKGAALLSEDVRGLADRFVRRCRRGGNGVLFTNFRTPAPSLEGFG